MTKRERILDLAKGRTTEGYVPAAFFLHFDKEFHRAPAAVDKHEEFFRATDMDFVKIQFELPFPRLELKSPSDWANIPGLEPGFFEPQLEVVRGIVNRLKGEAAIILTLYSPFVWRQHMVSTCASTWYPVLSWKRSVEILRFGRVGQLPPWGQEGLWNRKRVTIHGRSSTR